MNKRTEIAKTDAASIIDWTAYQIEKRKLDSLIAYARNPRTHSDDQIGQIVNSMRMFGWTIPVLIDEDDMIIAGHGRVMAAKILKIDEVPVIVARGWDEARKRAYVIADNRLTEIGGWNREMLKLELGELQAMKFDLKLTGFGDKDLVTFLATNSGQGQTAAQLSGLSYSVVVRCANESDMLKLIERFTKEGLKIEALIA